MSVAMSGIVVGGCRLVIAANGCLKCGVEFSEGWFEHKLPVIVAGKRHTLLVPICAGCAPHVPSVIRNSQPSLAAEPVEVGHL